MTDHVLAALSAAAKLGSGVFLAIVVVVYWRAFGPSNFLWLSDIALACTVLAIVFDDRLLASMPAVGVLPLELAWTADFLARGRLIGLASYMFDDKLPLHVRALSLFHIALPPILIFLLYRHGYDPHALFWQSCMTWGALFLSYACTEPDKNINWVFGPGRRPQRAIPPLAYLAIEMALLPALVLAPMHVLLQYAFPIAGRS